MNLKQIRYQTFFGSKYTAACGGTPKIGIIHFIQGEKLEDFVKYTFQRKNHVIVIWRVIFHDNAVFKGIYILTSAKYV